MNIERPQNGALTQNLRIAVQASPWKREELAAIFGKCALVSLQPVPAGLRREEQRRAARNQYHARTWPLTARDRQSALFIDQPGCCQMKRQHPIAFHKDRSSRQSHNPPGSEKGGRHEASLNLQRHARALSSAWLITLNFRMTAQHQQRHAVPDPNHDQRHHARNHADELSLWIPGRKQASWTCRQE